MFNSAQDYRPELQQSITISWIHELSRSSHDQALAAGDVWQFGSAYVFRSCWAADLSERHSVLTAAIVSYDRTDLCPSPSYSRPPQSRLQPSAPSRCKSCAVAPWRRACLAVSLEVQLLPKIPARLELWTRMLMLCRDPAFVMPEMLAGMPRRFYTIQCSSYSSKYSSI